MTTKFESKEGKTYVLVEHNSGGCTGCAFDGDTESCEASPADCVLIGPKGEFHVWMEAE